MLGRFGPAPHRGEGPADIVEADGPVVRVTGLVVRFQGQLVVGERPVKLALQTIDTAEPVQRDPLSLLVADLPRNLEQLLEAIERRLKLAPFPVDDAEEIEPV